MMRHAIRPAVVVAGMCLAGCAHADRAAPLPPQGVGAARVRPDPAAAPALGWPDYEKFSEDDAVAFNVTAKARPLVYTNLADYLVGRFNLSERPGIGVDIGGGPGDLIFELAGRTKQFYWVNTDINTWYAPLFAAEALKRGIGQRTGFVFADACALPFKDRYADFVVSRGSYQFWGNLEDGMREIHRVLKPGGQAFIGRGFPPTMREEDVRSLREKGAAGGPKYDPDKDAETFRAIMEKLGVKDFEVIRHKPQDPAVSYGVWLCFRAPLEKTGRYLAAAALDIRAILPDPPPDDSTVTRSEIDRMLALQAARTLEDVQHLNAEGVFSPALLTSVLGESCKSNALPRTDALLKYVGSDAKAVISAAKARWKRSRPWIVDSRIQPCIEKPDSFSYPSDRAAQCRVWAVVLCELFPASKEALLAKAERISQDRVLSGVHFPGDIEAGQKLGQAIVDRIMQSPVFQADLAAARAEIAGSGRP